MRKQIVCERVDNHMTTIMEISANVGAVAPMSSRFQLCRISFMMDM